MPDTFSVSPVSKVRTHNEERATMDINDLFDGIMKSINQFSEEIAEQRLQEKMRADEVRRMGVTMRRISSRKRGGV
jgi:hypothetical protein